MSDRAVDDVIQKQLAQYHLFREQMAENRELAAPRRAPVITVSRMTGCCARDMSKLLATELGLQVWAPELIDLVAKDARLSREVASILEPDSIERIEADIQAMVARQQCRDDEPTLALVRVIKTLALTGGVVIHGRAGAFILGEQADLRLRLVASEANRLGEVMRRRGLDAREAGVIMRAGDSRRTAFLRLLFHADIDDPRKYDLVLNTERIDPEGAVELCLRFLALSKPEEG